MSFKHFDTSNLNDKIKDILDEFIVFKIDNKITPNIEKIFSENSDLFNYFNELSMIMLEAEPPMTKADELDETVYSYFRKFYLMANKQFEELTTKEIEKSKDMIINKPTFNELDNIILHLSSFNSLFNEIQDLKVSQYQDEDIDISPLLDRTKSILEKTYSKEFKQSMLKYSLVIPNINKHIENIKVDINHYLAKVNDICNKTIMTKKTYVKYTSIVEQMLKNLELIQKDFKESKSLTESKFKTRNNLGDRSGPR